MSEQELVRRKRRGRFSFQEAKIPAGAQLTFARDDRIQCRVLDERKVEFEGASISLNQATLHALASFGTKWKSARAPLYWRYGGKTLDEHRRDVERKQEDLSNPR